MATVTAASENTQNISDSNEPLPTTEDTSLLMQRRPATSGGGPGGGDETKGKAAAGASTGNAEDGGALTDILKMMKRAEQFGVPMQLSDEEENHDSRAERFGTSSSVNGLDSSKQSEELQKMATSERLGIKQSNASDVEAKEEARLAIHGFFACLRWYYKLFSERMERSDILPAAIGRYLGLIVAKMFLDFSGRGDKLHVTLLLELLAFHMCFDVYEIFVRKCVKNHFEKKSLRKIKPEE